MVMAHSSAPDVTRVTVGFHALSDVTRVTYDLHAAMVGIRASDLPEAFTGYLQTGWRPVPVSVGPSLAGGR